MTKNKWKPTFSQSVLRRREARISLRSARLAGLLALSIGLLGLWISVYLGRRSAAKNAPTWADFTIATSTEAFQPRFTKDGVPSALSINGQTWTVVHIDQYYDQGIAGETYCKNKTISYIRTDSSTLLRTVLWHEIYHAAACVYGGDTYWNSAAPHAFPHDGIDHLGEFNAEFGLANPDFLWWASHVG